MQLPLKAALVLFFSEWRVKQLCVEEGDTWRTLVFPDVP